MSILTEKLPCSIEVGGKEIYIRTDYRVWLKFESIMFDASKVSIKKIADAVINCIDASKSKTLPENLQELIEALMLFHGCNEKPKTKKTNESENRKAPVFDFEEDAAYVYAAFLAQYGIDLVEIPHLHWFKFNALFRSLDDTSKIMKIMSWRDMDLSKIKDSEQRKVYSKLKETFALPDKRSEEERSSDNNAALSEMFFKGF